MKSLIVAIMGTLCLTNSISAQDPVLKEVIFKTWIISDTEPYKVKGILYDVYESSVSLAHVEKIRDFKSGEYQLVSYDVKNIEVIKIRKYKNVGKGILTGSLIGLVTGGLIGLVSGDDPPGTFFAMTSEEKSLFFGVPLTVYGGIIGGLIGSKKKKIPISGNQEVFKMNKNELIKYSIKGK